VGSPSRINDGLRRWQAEWSAEADLAARQAAAVRSSFLAASALRDHWRAYRDNLNSHEQGVMVVSLLKVLDHLELATGLKVEIAQVDDIFDLLPAVRIAARAAIDRGEEVRFGSALILDREKISARKLFGGYKSCALAEIEKVAVESGVLRIRQKGKLLAFGGGSVASIPNVFLFLRLLDTLVAHPSAIPQDRDFSMRALVG
jgi:hypothetical protein